MEIIKKMWEQVFKKMTSLLRSMNIDFMAYDYFL